MKMHSSVRNTESFIGNSNYHRKKNPQTSVPSEVNPGPALAHWIPRKPQSGPYRSGFLGGVTQHQQAPAEPATSEN